MRCALEVPNISERPLKAALSATALDPPRRLMLTFFIGATYQPELENRHG
jgi:hypothetical protein